LAIAISNDYFYIIDKLLSLGADPNIADNNGDTPLIKTIWLSMSTSVSKERIIELVIKLVGAGADVNAKNESGRTALFTAIYQNCTDIAMYLIEYGARCELEDILMSNFTLLHYACFQGNYTLVKALLEKKCNPNSIATSCESPVYIAVTKGYVDIVGLLVEYGADVNVFIGMPNDNKCTGDNRNHTKHYAFRHFFVVVLLHKLRIYTGFCKNRDQLVKGL
jgi:ankyrin repeat protein